MNLEEAHKLAMNTDYACFACTNEGLNEINVADASAFFLAGFEHASKFSHPNDSKRIELLEAVSKEAHKALGDICASYMSVVDDYCEGYFKAREDLEKFDSELKKLQESKQLDLFEVKR